MVKTFCQEILHWTAALGQALRVASPLAEQGLVLT
tara:strand:+ start:653 stop:757 length:105 start_codon:yes stop_codon:yes gene_type:complete